MGKPEAADDKMVETAADGQIGRSASCRTILKENSILLLTLIGVVLGFAIGFGVREANPSADALMWIGMPGELFLRMLNMLIVPLIVGSVISGTSSLDPKSNGKMSLVALAWITSTNVLSCVVAVILAVTIKPGEGGGGSDTEQGSSSFETQDIFADLLRNLIPNNIVEVGFRKAVTQYSTTTEEVARNLTNGSIVVETIETRSKSSGKSDSVNVLGLIFICLIFGISANRLGNRAEAFLNFFSVLTEIVLMVLKWFFWSSPIGVASLIAKAIAGIDDLQDSFSKLGMFVVVVVVGIVIFQFIVLSLLLFVVAKKNPFYFHLSILRPYFLGFAATSTAVAIPEMLHCVEVKNNVDQRIARFAIPFSVTLSANGSAIFIVSAAIFIAQYIGHDLSAGDVIIVAFLTAVSAMALPSVPSSSLVTLVIILAAINIPSGTIALLFTVEWFLDRIRSGCNVVSHCYCAAVADRFCRAGLPAEHKDNAMDDVKSNGETNRAYTDDMKSNGETNRVYTDDETEHVTTRI